MDENEKKRLILMQNELSQGLKHIPEDAYKLTFDLMRSLTLIVPLCLTVAFFLITQIVQGMPLTEVRSYIVIFSTSCFIIIVVVFIVVTVGLLMDMRLWRSHKVKARFSYIGKTDMKTEEIVRLIESIEQSHKHRGNEALTILISIIFAFVLVALTSFSYFPTSTMIITTLTTGLLFTCLLMGFVVLADRKATNAIRGAIRAIDDFIDRESRKN